MSFSVNACAITNITPGGQRGFNIFLTGDSGANLALTSPYIINVRDAGGAVVANWTTLITQSTTGKCIVGGESIASLLPSGNYTVEVFSPTAGVTVTKAVVMTDPIALSVSNGSVTGSAFCNTNSGILSFAFTGPTPLSYILYKDPDYSTIIASGVISSPNFTIGSLTAGTYNIQFNYSYTCNDKAYTGVTCNIPTSISETYIVPGDTSSIVITTTHNTSEDCAKVDGTLGVVATGGTAPYDYGWAGPGGFTGNGPNISGLATGSYALTVTDANGCVGYATFFVDLLPGPCGGCYSLTDCFPGALGSPTYYVYGTDLMSLDGLIINGVQITGQYVDPTKCWLVTAVQGINVVCATALPFEGYDNFYSECDPCKYTPPVPEPTPVHSTNDPVFIPYQIKESECDIQVVKQFAGGYYSLVKKLKYGVTDCCKAIDLAELWVNKQVSDLGELLIPGYECRSTPNNGCGWLPLQGCEICPNTTGGITILAIAGEDILFGKLVMLSNDGKLYLNDPTVSTTYQRCIGFTTMDVLKNNTVRVLIIGLFTNVNWSLTSGNIYYASQSGGITSTIPVNPPLAISQMIGTATSSTTLLVDIKQPNIL